MRKREHDEKHESGGRDGRTNRDKKKMQCECACLLVCMDKNDQQEWCKIFSSRSCFNGAGPKTNAKLWLWQHRVHVSQSKVGNRLGCVMISYSLAIIVSQL